MFISLFQTLKTKMYLFRQEIGLRYFSNRKFPHFWNFWKIRKIKSSPESARSSHKLGHRPLPPGGGGRACGHLVCLPDYVFLRSTPSGRDKFIIYSTERSDPRITQISSVFVSSLFSVADLEQDVVPGICGGEQSPSSLWRRKC